jgi:L-fuculose-phosphate aldolase
MFYVDYPPMNDEENAIVNRLIEFGQVAENKHLVWGPSGNISHRVGEKLVITGSGAHLENLDAKDFVIMDLEGKKLEREIKPSIEFRMHSAIYRTWEDAKAVFHSQAFFTTLMSCTDLEVDPKLFPESMAYLKEVNRIPYHHPGSRELAQVVEDCVGNYDVMVLNNHGAICAGRDLDEVLIKTETLEFLCRMIVMSKAVDIKLNFLPEKVRDEFLKHLKDLK